MVRNTKTDKPRGYAFIEYKEKRDFVTAYKQADGRRIDGRRVLVDCERGRTIKDWLPMRFGGGKGEARKGNSEERALQKELNK